MIGELTGNEELEAEGSKHQVTGNLKQAGDSAEDAGSKIADNVTS